MLRRQLFSRRDSEEKVDFRPDADPKSPFAQLRRLEVYLERKNADADDLTDCTDALNAYREYLYRKVFTGTTHEQFLAEDPEVVDWLLAISEIDAIHFQQRRSNEKRGN